MLIELTDKRKKYLEQFDAWVRFEVVSEKEGFDYREFFRSLFKDFIIWADLKNQELGDNFIYRRTSHWNGDEGGMGGIYIKGFYFGHCKMYLYDGMEKGEIGINLERWKGVMFRDHNDDIQDVAKVHLIADAFEEFLKEKGQPYERNNKSAK